MVCIPIPQNISHFSLKIPRVNYVEITLLIYFCLKTDWDSYDSHIKFTKAPAYDDFRKIVDGIMTGVHYHHVAFKPFPPKISTSAPVIEFATFLDTKPHFLDNVDKFMKAVGVPEKCYGGAWGDSVETDVGKHVDGSVKGKVTVVLIGWESKEAHMEFRETETFAENIGLLREGMGGVEMVSLSACVCVCVLSGVFSGERWLILMGSFMFLLRLRRGIGRVCDMEKRTIATCS